MSKKVDNKTLPSEAETLNYRWIVLVCSFLTRFLVFGSVMSVGVLYVEWLDEFEMGLGNTALVGSIATGSVLLMGMALNQRFSTFGPWHLYFVRCMIKFERVLNFLEQLAHIFFMMRACLMKRDNIKFLVFEIFRLDNFSVGNLFNFVAASRRSNDVN